MNRLDAHYCFNTIWTIAAPIDAVWAALDSPGTWPRWWPGCVIVEPLNDGGKCVVGSHYRFYWRGPLPYCLVIRIAITDLDLNRRIGGRVDGPVNGRAEWRLWEEQGNTKAEFVFAVSGSRPWMRWVAPLARPVFRWNHSQLMAKGELGLRRWLAKRQPTTDDVKPGIG